MAGVSGVIGSETLFHKEQPVKGRDAQPTETGPNQ
jgi:hypothetical protein